MSSTPVEPEGRLHARPSKGVPAGVTTRGLHPLGLGVDRDGLVYVPSCKEALRAPLPLVLSLHGAGGSAASAVGRLQQLADDAGFLVLAPDSRGPTWDVLQGGFGPDARFIDEALGHVFQNYAVDPGRVAIEGFSDGASYALSLGITNGDLFGAIIALSPGSAAAGGSQGSPKVWISHGTEDRVLSIDATSRRLATALERSGFHLRYTEFKGGHTAPEWLTAAAIKWWLASEEEPRG